MTRRRLVLASLAFTAFVGPPLASGCAADYPPISEIDGLRVLAVVADKPYAQPGDTINLTLTYDDAEAYGPAPDVGTGGSATSGTGGAGHGTRTARPIQVMWISGCVDPDGDEYYGCYASLEAAVKGGAAGSSGVTIAVGETGTATAPLVKNFSFTLPDDIISRRPKPAAGTPYYGIAYVFFAVCAGTVKYTGEQASGSAGSFPLACVDASGNPLGADSFVPGYTSVYAFADGRTNANPPIQSFDVLPADGSGDAGVDGSGDAGVDGSGDGSLTSVPVCSISEADRAAAGCGHKDPFSACTAYQMGVTMDPGYAELDPATKGDNGTPLHEEVWVDYFADSGDVQDPLLLLWDAKLGQQANTSTLWIPPPQSGVANLWAVVHDSRGGESVAHQQIVVQ